jgi:hypothetical protein
MVALGERVSNEHRPYWTHEGQMAEGFHHSCDEYERSSLDDRSLNPSRDARHSRIFLYIYFMTADSKPLINHNLRWFKQIVLKGEKVGEESGSVQILNSPES